MRRILNIALLVTFMALLIGLYHIRYAVEIKQSAIAETQKAITHENALHKILQTEWVSLNNPARLEMLATHYLNMSPMEAAQIYPIGLYPFPIRVSPASVVHQQPASVAHQKLHQQNEIYQETEIHPQNQTNEINEARKMEAEETE